MIVFENYVIEFFFPFFPKYQSGRFESNFAKNCFMINKSLITKDVIPLSEKNSSIKITSITMLASIVLF